MARAQRTLRRHQDAVEHALEFAGALGQLAVACLVGVAAAEQLVGDVERGEHRQARAQSPVGVDSAAARIFSST